MLTAYNDPSNVTVHRILSDGTFGQMVNQPTELDTGIYAHQIRAVPSNRSVILIARGNNATATKAEDPGSIHVFGFNNGILSPLQVVRPGNGLGFGPRHLDFHPTKPWVYVSIERQNQIYLYDLQPDGKLGATPRFVKSSLLDPRAMCARARARARSMSIRMAGSCTRRTATRASLITKDKRSSAAARTTLLFGPSIRRPASQPLSKRLTVTVSSCGPSACILLAGCWSRQASSPSRFQERRPNPGFERRAQRLPRRRKTAG